MKKKLESSCPSDATTCCLSSVEGGRSSTDRMRKWRAANREKVEEQRQKNRERMKKQWHENPVAKQRCQAWREKNHDKYLASARASGKRCKKQAAKREAKRRQVLADRYVKDLLVKRSSLKVSDIPQELVELKRMHLKVHRQLKQNEL